MPNSFILRIVVVVIATMVLASCATQVVEKPSPVNPSPVRFSTFDEVVLVRSELGPEYAGQGANIKAADKIDEVLESHVRDTFDDVRVVQSADTVSISDDDRVLVIAPKIKQIKFIGGAARFWAGAMAGSSVVVMDVHFIDANTGELIVSPGFQRKAGAYSDAFGTASNRMLSDVAQDVAIYMQGNY